MLPTAISQGNNLSLNEVIARIQQHDAVDGVLLMGSTGQNALSLASDYDLVVVLSHQPEPLALLHTVIDQRLAEVYFFSIDTLDQIVEKQNNTHGGALPSAGDHVAFYTWLQNGQIAFDRNGRLARVQQHLRSTEWFKPADDAQRYAIWFGHNYNLQHTKWIARSDDPLYQREVDIRLLFTVFFLFCDYFHIRGLPWQGSKAAMHWLEQHDPSYLALFHSFLDATNRIDKLAMYEQLVPLTLAPVGQLLSDQQSMVNFAPDSAFEPAMIERGLAFWESLLGE
ncbi:MAG: hypothetical protein ABIV47_22850 [Roseiflexaceae bacterium]